MLYHTFPDTLAVPYDSLLRSLLGGFDHKGGPIWPQWDSQVAARFNRNGKPTDTLPERRPTVDHAEGESWFWCGPITAHFGHGISDYATRIAGSMAAGENVDLVFSSEKDGLVASLSDAPKWFAQMLLDWFLVPAERIHFVTAPTFFETLHVVPQAEQNDAVGPGEDYLDLLDSVTERHFRTSEKRGTVYISRAGIGGKFAGEVAFEAAMKSAGVAIVRPETMPLVDQLRALASAERLIFAEGSAIHGAQLMGRALGDVIVINRRRRFKLAEAFIQPRARSLRYLDHVGGMVYGLTEAGKSAAAIGISFMDIPALLDSLEGAGISIKSHWDSKAYDAEIWNDLMFWLRATARRPSSRLPLSRDTIYHTLVASGLSGWVSRAKEVLGEDRPAIPS